MVSTELNYVDSYEIDNPNVVLSINVTVGEETITSETVTHSLDIAIGEEGVFNIPIVLTESGTYSFPVTLSNQQKETLGAVFKTTKSANFTYTLTTYDNGTTIGSSVYVAPIFTTSENSSPDVSEIIARSNLKIFDTNTNVRAVTGDRYILLQNKSEIHATFRTTYLSAKTGADIVTISVAILGDRFVSAPYNSSVNTFDLNYGSVGISGSTTLRFGATDSRGYSTAIFKSIDIIPFSDISLTDYTVRRANNADNYLDIDLSGKTSPVNINGTDKNAIQSASYRYSSDNEETWSSWNAIDLTNAQIATITSSAYDISYETGHIFDLDTPYIVEVNVADKLSSQTVKIKIPIATPLVRFRQGIVDINGDFYVKGVSQDYIVESGTTSTVVVDKTVNWFYRKYASGFAELYGVSADTITISASTTTNYGTVLLPFELSEIYEKTVEASGHSATNKTQGSASTVMQDTNNQIVTTGGTYKRLIDCTITSTYTQNMNAKVLFIVKGVVANDS